MEIICVDFKRRSRAEKLEEQSTANYLGLPGKKPEVRKSESLFDLNKPSLWLKRMILEEQGNVFLFEFGLIIPAVLKCLFRQNFCIRSLPPAEKLPLFTHFFAPVKDFLDVYNVEQPGQT